jgi:ABC-type transport system involved in multi-copper enzyme maturation permease subunit
MTWLVWKEYRQNRLIVLFLCILMLAPAAIVAVIHFAEANDRPWTSPQEAIAMAVFNALAITQVILALIGGLAFAGERADRSAEFQAYLPVPRWKTFVAKLLLALCLAAVIWLPTGILLGVNHWNPQFALDGPCQSLRGISAAVPFIAITGLTFFCIGWFFSSFTSSPTLAVFAGLLTPFILAVGIGIGSEIFGLARLEDSLIKFCFVVICPLLSAIGFLIGSWLFLRRVEP